MTRIVIFGGYGTFGLKAAERLGRDPALHITLAGRNRVAAEEAVAALRPRVAARLDAVVLDARAPDLAALQALAPVVVYNASGPFQTQGNYALARAAIALGAHYVDLADARAFVAAIDVLDGEARAAGVTVVSGASSVPGLSSAVIEHVSPQFARLERLTFGILPANGFDPGVATTTSILSYVGRPFETRMEGHVTRVFGWQGLWRYRFPGLGARWLGHCDVPDLDLFPKHYPTLQHIHFSAGMEVPVMHWGLWALSGLVRARLLRRPERLAAPLLALKRRMSAFGSDRGGMLMLLDGVGLDGAPKRIAWHLIARDNQGPFLPQVPATLLARQLVAGTFKRRGAFACVGLVTLEDVLAEVSDLAITATTS